MTLDELIAKLESAAEGSRELDGEIMAIDHDWTLAHRPPARCSDECCPEGRHLDWRWVERSSGRWVTTAANGFEFTTSLDASLTLVPEGQNKAAFLYHAAWQRGIGDISDERLALHVSTMALKARRPA